MEEARSEYTAGFEWMYFALTATRSIFIFRPFYSIISAHTSITAANMKNSIRRLRLISPWDFSTKSLPYQR